MSQVNSDADRLVAEAQRIVDLITTDTSATPDEAEWLKPIILSALQQAQAPQPPLQWTLDNIYTIARRELRRMERTGSGYVGQESWGHVLRLCQKAGCQSRGVLRDNGGAV